MSISRASDIFSLHLSGMEHQVLQCKWKALVQMCEEMENLMENTFDG